MTKGSRNYRLLLEFYLLPYTTSQDSLVGINFTANLSDKKFKITN